MRIRAAGDTVLTHPLAGPTGADSALGLLADADVSFANLEVTLTDSGHPAEKVSVLRADPTTIAEYARLGVDAWSIATNHALDYGVDGLRSTMALLRSHGMPFAGAGEDIDAAVAPVYVDARSGERVGFLNFCSVLPPGARATSQRPGLAPIRVGQSYEFDGVRLDEQPGSPPTVHTWAQETDVLRAEDAVARTARDCDVVVVALHWGVPWCFLPANQGPLAEYQQPLGRRLVDAGARVVIGHHAHALQPVEFHGVGVILYSTGNFAFHDTEALPAVDRRITPALKPVLRGGPWFESAVFEVVLDDDAVAVNPIPIELDAHGEPMHARPDVARRIRDYLSESTTPQKEMTRP
ncbi:MAG: hypothetical protein GEV10_00710 [Streptosporangiales bacterium]|nr:hypothetical protein [Streptosporangiales bacterium]